MLPEKLMETTSSTEIPTSWRQQTKIEWSQRCARRRERRDREERKTTGSDEAKTHLDEATQPTLPQHVKRRLARVLLVHPRLPLRLRLCLLLPHLLHLLGVPRRQVLHPVHDSLHALLRRPTRAEHLGLQVDPPGVNLLLLLAVSSLLVLDVHPVRVLGVLLVGPGQTWRQPSPDINKTRLPLHEGSVPDAELVDPPELVPP